jgi:hypothetical protein
MDEQIRSVRTGAICLIIFSLAVIAATIILDYLYLYPSGHGASLHLNLAILEKPGIREYLAIIAFLPFFLVPGAVGVYSYLQSEAQGTMRTAMYFALLGALAWVIDAMLWPSLNWYLATGYTVLAKGKMTNDMLYLIGGLNSYFHVFIGVYLKVFALSFWMWLVSWTGLRHNKLPAWLCYFGIVLAIIAWITLLARILFGDPLIIDYGVNVYPIYDLWIFFLGCFMLAKINKEL